MTGTDSKLQASDRRRCMCLGTYLRMIW